MFDFCLFMIMAVAFVNGMTDAPNAVGGAVASGAVKPRTALLLSACFNFLGVCFRSGIFARVSKNVFDLTGSGREPDFSQICAILCATVVFALLAWAYSIPTSESHALLGAITGVSLAFDRLDLTALRALQTVLFGFVASVFFGALFSFVLTKAIGKINLSFNFKPPLIFLSALNSFLHGSQDGQKFVALALMLTGASNDSFLIASVGFFVAVGTLFGGGRILKKLCFEAVDLDEHKGLCAELSGTVSLFALTAFGFPISTTHTKTASMIGASATGGLGKVSLQSVTEIALTWVLTYPGSALLGFVFAKLLT